MHQFVWPYNEHLAVPVRSITLIPVITSLIISILPSMRPAHHAIYTNVIHIYIYFKNSIYSIDSK